MPLAIEDPGSGDTAKVGSSRLFTTAVTHLGIWQHAVKDGLAYSWSANYNYAAADTILLVENTSSTHRLHIEDIWLSGDTETRVVIHRPTGDVTTAGTAVTGVNLNSGFATPAPANGIQDETGNTQGDILWRGEIQAATNPVCVKFYGAVTLGQNRSIGVDYVSVGTAADVVILGYYVPNDMEL